MFAQLDLRVEENGFVDEVLAEEGSVEVGAGLEEDAKDIAFREGIEDGGQGEASGVFGDGFDVDVARGQVGNAVGGSGGAGEDQNVRALAGSDSRGTDEL